jgi:hypothetical protein
MRLTSQVARSAALLSLLAPAWGIASAQGTNGAGGARRPQAPPPASSRPAALLETPPPIGPLNGLRLKPGKWQYTTKISAAGQTQSVPRSLTIGAVTYTQRPAWLIVDAQGAGERMVVDSLYLTRDELAPLHHVIHLGPSKLAVSFSADSAVGEAVSPQGSQPVRGPYTRGAMVSGAMLEAALRVLPLRAGWRATVNMFSLRPGGAQVAPVAVVVAGEETVTVPAGVFPSWIVEMGAGGAQQRLWLNKTTGQIVKVTMQGGPGMTAETVLLPAGR